MSYHIFTHNLESIESNYEISDNTFFSSAENIYLANSNHPRAPVNIYTSTNFATQSDNLLSTPWRPSKKLLNLYKRFQDVILYQFPCIADWF